MPSQVRSPVLSLCPTAATHRVCAGLYTILLVVYLRVTYLTTHSVSHGVGHDIWLEGLWEGTINFVFDSLYPGRVWKTEPP